MSESVGKYGGFNIATAGPMLAAEIGEVQDVPTYIAGLAAYFQGTPIYEILESIAAIVEPLDRTTGQRAENSPAAHAFFSGSLLALRAVEHATGTDFVLSLRKDNVRLLTPKIEDEDMKQKVHDFATAMQVMGDQGYDEADGLHEELDEWDILATGDVRTTAYFKRGFGLMTKIASQAIADRELLDFQAMMADMGVDEDAFSHLAREFDT